MAKKQSRRSISIGRTTFDEMKDIAAAAGVSLSKLTERALRDLIVAARETSPNTWLTQLGEWAKQEANRG